MRRVFLKCAVGCCTSLLLSINSFGQNIDGLINTKQSQIDNIVAGYNSNGDQSRLFTAPAYNFYSSEIKGNAYFVTAEFTTGNVEYDGFTYKNLQLMYDLTRGSVVMQLPSKASSVELVSDRVQSFDISGHHFVRIDADENFTAGFYDQLYNGKTEFITHREKALQAGDHFTNEVTTMYLKIDGEYKSFDNQKSLLGLLKNKKTEVTMFIKDNDIDFEANKEQATIKILAYYDQIIAAAKMGSLTATVKHG